MYRAAPRLIARSALPQRTLAPARRFLSTAPPTQKSRSWKSLVARFGIAGTIIYYYNNTDVFAEEPRYPVQALPETETESEHLPTIESIAAEREKRKAVQAQLDAQAQAQKEAQSTQQDGGEGGMQGLEGEADQQGAFNPETGEINWDCPCLGGMATGPCGEQFKAAFSCFVYSEEEPKGMDCIDKFKDMQNCFREYPEVYGSELEGDEEGEDMELSEPAQGQPQPQSESAPAAAYSDSSSAPAPSSKPQPARETSAPEKAALSGEPSSTRFSTTDKMSLSSEPGSKPSSAAENRNKLGLVPDNYKPDAKEEPVSESEELVPKAAHDGR